MKRLEILDFYRFLAILIVMLFHYFSRWTTPFNRENLYPYGNQYDFFIWGRLGVQFFFIISGFVISMTLEKSVSAIDFAKKRILRLWPSMILVPSITFVVFSLFDSEKLFPFSSQWSNLFYSWTFLGKGINHQGFRYIDGSYWSLWVEVQFYVLAALIYFILRQLKKQVYFPWTIFAISLIACWLKPQLEIWKDSFDLWNYINFFVMGVLFKELFGQISSFTIKLWYFHAMIMASLAIEILFLSDDMLTRFVSMAFVGAFYLFLFCSSKQINPKGYWWSVGVYFGEASYVSYLIHQNIGLLIISKIGYKGPFDYLIPIIIIVVVFGVGTLLYRFYEKPIMTFLKSKWFKKVDLPH